MSKIPTARGYIHISEDVVEIEGNTIKSIRRFWDSHPIFFIFQVAIIGWIISDDILNIIANRDITLAYTYIIMLVGGYIIWRIYHIVRGFTFVDTIPIGQIDHVDLINSWRLGGRIVIHYETADGHKKRKVRIIGGGETNSILQKAEEHFEESGITIQARQGMATQVRR